MQLTPTPRTRVRRVPKRASYDRAVIDAILDEGLVCHLAFVRDGHPFCVPTLHARIGDTVYVHFASKARPAKASADAETASVCLTVTHIDGLILARSAFHHSVQYRSVMVVGPLRPVELPDEKMQALELFTERLMPGRWDDVRRPNRQELKATSVLALKLDEASAKVNEGGVADEEEDYALPVWAGVVPLTVGVGAPVDDERLQPGVTVPSYVRGWSPSNRGSSSVATTRSTDAGEYAESIPAARSA